MKQLKQSSLQKLLPLAMALWSVACGPAKNEKFYDTPPKLTNQAHIDSVRLRVYPKEFQSRGIGGRVELGVYITAAAKNTQIRVTKGSGIRELDSAAVKVARAMVWEPALKDTKPVGAYVKFPITFGPRVD